MKFEDIYAKVGHVPFIREQNARWLYQHILEQKMQRILELGIAHGTATCYMAAAFEELKGGLVTAVDLVSAQSQYVPSAEDQLRGTGLERFASIRRELTGYNWFLHNEIAANTADGQCREIYDLCIIDGPKNWTIDGAAFFMADKLLKQGGWMIFDDYNWRYADADGERDVTDGITHRSLSEAERNTPHIREVFELLVKQHPSYSEFVVIPDGDWAIAHKLKSNLKRYSILYHDPKPLQTRILRFLKRLRGDRHKRTDC